MLLECLRQAAGLVKNLETLSVFSLSYPPSRRRRSTMSGVGASISVWQWQPIYRKKKKKGQSSPSLSSLCLTVGGARRRWGLRRRPRAPLPQAAAAIALARMVPKLGRAVFPPAPFSPLVLSLFTRTLFLVPPCGIPPTPRSELGSNQMRPIDCNSISGAIICYLSALSDRRRRGHITSSHSGTFSRTEGVLGGGEGRARRRRTDGQPC